MKKTIKNTIVLLKSENGKLVEKEIGSFRTPIDNNPSFNRQKDYEKKCQKELFKAAMLHFPLRWEFVRTSELSTGYIRNKDGDTISVVP